MLLTRAQQQAAASGPVYDPSAAALFARMSVQPDATRKALINATIIALKSAGVWAKMDALYVTAAHDAQAARLNWLAATNTLVPAASPVFAVDRGYTGDGTTSYLDTGFAIPGGQMTQNNAHFGFWTGTAATANLAYDMGSSGSFRGNAQTGATTIGAALNNAILNPLAAAPFTGYTAGFRDNAANFSTYRNGVLVALTVSASTAVAAGTMGLLTRAVGVGQSTRRLQLAHWGVALSAAEILATYAAFAAYMAAIGA